MLKIFNQIITEQINLIAIPMNFFRKSNTPNQPIYPFIMIIFCNLRSIEMDLKHIVVRFKHDL